MSTTLTYVIHMVGPSRDGRGLYKIGRTNDRGIDRRIGDLQTGNPFPLEFARILVGWRENALHTAFHEWRTLGEWFWLTPDQVRGIRGTAWENEALYVGTYAGRRKLSAA